MLSAIVSLSLFLISPTGHFGSVSAADCDDVCVRADARNHNNLLYRKMAGVSHMLLSRRFEIIEGGKRQMLWQAVRSDKCFFPKRAGESVGVWVIVILLKGKLMYSKGVWGWCRILIPFRRLFSVLDAVNGNNMAWPFRFVDDTAAC